MGSGRLFLSIERAVFRRRASTILPALKKKKKKAKLEEGDEGASRAGAGLDGRSGTGAESRGRWKMPAAFLLVSLVGLGTAYYWGYVKYGKDLRWNYFEPDYVTGWSPPLWLEHWAYKFWEPPRNWDRARVRRAVSGKWELSDGRGLTLRLKPDMKFVMASPDFPEVNFEGIWELTHSSQPPEWKAELYLYEIQPVGGNILGYVMVKLDAEDRLGLSSQMFEIPWTSAEDTDGYRARFRRVE